MFESMAAWVMVEHLYGETCAPPIDTIGYKRILNPNRRPFKTRDGYLAILPYTDQNWRDFFALAGRDDLLADPRYKTLASRPRHIELLYEELAPIALTPPNAEWLPGVGPPPHPGPTPPHPPGPRPPTPHSARRAIA